MIRGVMEMEFRTLRAIMVPRTDILAWTSTTVRESGRGHGRRGYSRVPIYEENIDNVIGIAHAKEVLKQLARAPQA